MKRFLLLPSAYGCIGWAVWFGIYLLLPIGWSAPSSTSLEVYWAVTICFLASAILSVRLYRFDAIPRCASDMRIGVVCGAIGLVGIAWHCAVLARAFGGWLPFFNTLLQHSYEVRAAGEDVLSIGIQLSYFGWIACAIWAHALASYSSDSSRRGSRDLMLMAAAWILTLLLNVALVDRTRPFWIVTLSALMVIAARTPRWGSVRLVAVAGSTAATLLAIFAIVAVWVGKVGDHVPGRSIFEAAAFNMTIYGTGGFAYFDTVNAYHHDPLYLPERSLYPLFKFAAAAGIGDEPPSQILEFESVPYEVNVGTFLTPLYLDGGWVYVTLGILLSSFGADALGMYLLRSGSALKRVAWASLCFCNLLAFFTSHFASTPFWVILSLAVVLPPRRESSRALGSGRPHMPIISPLGEMSNSSRGGS